MKKKMLMFNFSNTDLDKVISSILDRLSIYVIPTAITALTLVAFLFWGTQQQQHSGNPLAVRVIQDNAAQGLSAGEALQQLSFTQPAEFHDTGLSEAPFWFLFTPPVVTQDSGGGEQVIEFPSRHATEIVCWKAATLEPLGRANRSVASGDISAIGPGFALNAERLTGGPVLCRGHYAGPARLSVNAWDKKQFTATIQSFIRDSGLIDGGLGILALFVVITAIINREWIYVLFAVWLLTNLRLAALSAGWDTQWLGRSIPVDWIPLMRKINISCYYVLTVVLFDRLFDSDLKRVGYKWLLRWNRWSCLFMMMATALPYGRYLPIMWLMTGVAGSIIVFLLIRILLVTRSRVAVWFSASLAIAMLSGFSEVIAAALGMKGTVSLINSVTAALFSSLIAALAIAQQMRDERLERRRAEAALRSTYQEIPIGLFTLDQNGIFLRANPTLTEMLGITVGEDVRSWADCFGDDTWRDLGHAIKSDVAVDMELHHQHRSGDDRWYLVRVKKAEDRIEGSLQDVSERYRATERLKYLANHDSLTGVFNRRGIEPILAHAIKDQIKEQRCVLACLDLDRFKLINDLYGHGTGDEVLRDVCRRVESLLGDTDSFGRIGGDEFVIVFGRAQLHEAADRCRRLIDAVGGRPFLIGDKAFRVGCSIGLVEVGVGVAVDDAIAGSDRACREAKKGSGGQLVVYEKDSPAFNEREHELYILKRFSVDSPPEGLFLVMQPIMSLRTPYDSLNFEVLLRMYLPDSSIESAWRVINTAEKNGRIALIDRWVLKNVLEWIDANSDSLSRTNFVSLNLSGGSLNDERFIEDAYALIAAHPRAASRVCFEITESVAVSDIANTLRFVNRVRGYGAKVALDDFGVGYTSFSYLHSLSADVLKIDGSLVSAALAHPANMSIIEAIASLSSNLGMTSVAEHAGDLNTVKAMVGVGIDYVQSYAIGRPQMPEVIVEARSAADFIQDKQIEQYVRTELALGTADELWLQTGARRQDLH